MDTYNNKACCRARGARFRRTRGGGRSIGRKVVILHAPFEPAPQKLRTFSHTKIIIRSTCAHCARKKRAAVCIFQPFEGVFFFLLYALCANRPRVFVLFEQALHYTAYLLGLQVLTILACMGIARFFYTVSKQNLMKFAPRDGTNRCTKTAKPPTDTQGVVRRFGRYWIGIGALLRCIAVGGTGIEQRRAAWLRLSGRCWQ